MTQVLKVLAVAIVLALWVSPAFAQEDAGASGAGVASQSGIWFSGPFAAGLVTIGAAYGIGKLASSALESMARQPEVAGSIQTAMIIAAALIEGFTFFALYICMIAADKGL